MYTLREAGSAVDLVGLCRSLRVFLQVILFAVSDALETRLPMKLLLAMVLFGLVGGMTDDPAKKDPAQADFDKLQGTWVTVAITSDGKKVLDEKSPPSNVKLAYEGHTWKVKVGDNVIATGSTKLDPSKSPKEIDVTHETGRKKGETLLGIYELNGDTYKYCIAQPGKSRPKDFVSKEGTGDSLIISKREKPAK
jgi:uncharacterized protein (TIGR03067 family)